MTYEELLKDYRWAQRRYQILIRDWLTCQKCKNEKIKKKSRRATLVKHLDYAQAGDLRKKPIGLIDIHKIEMLDVKTKITHQTYVRIWPELCRDLDLKGLKYYYTEIGLNPDNENGNNGTTITLIEKPLDSAKFKTIFAKSLHVHHEYYQDDTLPWEYPDQALTTLCWMCHEEFHAKQNVKWLDKYGNKKGVLTPCNKCHGAGYIPQYSHIQNGRCFDCQGVRYFELIS